MENQEVDGAVCSLDVHIVVNNNNNNKQVDIFDNLKTGFNFSTLKINKINKCCYLPVKYKRLKILRL